MMINRGDASVCSMFPGLGHVYIKSKSGLWAILLGYMVIITMFILFVQSKNSLLFFPMIFFLFAMIFHSMVETEYLCNMKGIPYIGNPGELRIKDYSKAIIASAMIPGMIAIVILSVLCTIDYDPYTLATILLWILYITVIVLFAKNAAIRDIPI